MNISQSAFPTNGNTTMVTLDFPTLLNPTAIAGSEPEGPRGSVGTGTRHLRQGVGEVVLGLIVLLANLLGWLTVLFATYTVTCNYIANW